MACGLRVRRPDPARRTASPRRGAGLLTVVAIVGPTASGKSRVAEAAAERFGAVIVSVDSMQVYRGMDIGTAKAPRDVRDRIPHRMVDVADPAEDYDVRRFQADGRTAIDEAMADGGRVIIAGGSGLHLRALVDPLSFAPTDAATRTALEQLAIEEVTAELLAADPMARDHVDLDNARRVIRAVEVIRLGGGTPSSRADSPEGRAVRAYESRIPFVGLGVDAGEAVSDRVDRRFQSMLDAGLLDEVAGLAGTLGATASQAVGYKELLPVIGGAYDLEVGIERALGATRALVKRQRTYFRRDPRIAWLPWQDAVDDRVRAMIDEIGERTSWTS